MFVMDGRSFVSTYYSQMHANGLRFVCKARIVNGNFLM